jgi:NADH dehydrogenase [ubiquinone] 1 alpha subcomplex assembly factor 1
MEQELIICNFSTSCFGWRNVDDVVMGGISVSSMQVDRQAGIASFAGTLSLERNGGFASVRTTLEQRDLSRFTGFRLMVRGDGKRYSFRVRNDDRFDGVVYAADFETDSGVRQEINLPFSLFRPLFRGVMVSGAPAMDPCNVAQIGFLISSKQEGAFRLEVERISAVDVASDT